MIQYTAGAVAGDDILDRHVVDALQVQFVLEKDHSDLIEGVPIKKVLSHTLFVCGVPGPFDSADRRGESKVVMIFNLYNVCRDAEVPQKSLSLKRFVIESVDGYLS